MVPREAPFACLLVVPQDLRVLVIDGVRVPWVHHQAVGVEVEGKVHLVKVVACGLATPKLEQLPERDVIAGPDSPNAFIQRPWPTIVQPVAWWCPAKEQGLTFLPVQDPVDILVSERVIIFAEPAPEKPVADLLGSGKLEMPEATVVDVNVARDWYVATIKDDLGFATVAIQEMLDKAALVLPKAFADSFFPTSFRKWTSPARGWACVGQDLIEQPLVSIQHQHALLELEFLIDFVQAVHLRGSNRPDHVI